MGTSQHEQVAAPYAVPISSPYSAPSALALQSPDERLIRRRLGLSHCFLAASSQHSQSFCLVKQKELLASCSSWLWSLSPRSPSAFQEHWHVACGDQGHPAD